MRPADLLIHNALPWSDGTPVRDADALAIADGRIVALGHAAELAGLAGPRTRRFDARGCTVTPGLTDTHLHLVAWARSLREVRLEGLRTRTAVVSAVAAASESLPEGAILVGRGWASTEWEAQPHHGVLDAIAPDRPVLLHSKDFHAVWVNQAAMTRAAIRADVQDPPGGQVVRDGSGRPTGVFLENAAKWFGELVPPPTVATDLDLVGDAVEQLLASGITEVHDFEGDAEAALLEALVRGEGPRLRVLMHLPRLAMERALASGIVSGAGDDWFRWGALKLFADGTLGSRTAALLDPYDGTEELGISLIPSDDLKGWVGRSVRGGLSVAVHAIGDRAVRQALDAFQASGSALGRLALPPRIEHAQLVHDDDLPRFAALGVAASVQPIHATSDRPLAERLWGSRLRRCYPWRALLDAGARVAFGSDAPVEPPSPALGIHAAVTRETPDRPGDAFVPAQRVALDEALLAYTRAAAVLAGTWPRRGRLAVGCTADVVLWDADLHRLPPSRLHLAAPVATLLDGEVAYERAGAAAAAGGVH